jgi:DNA-directed RNA polymerase specialized sigma24 family protein
MGKAQENGKKSVGIAYATAADFRHIFTEDINSLYLVSLLLTGNQEKAEECFVTGIGESTKANYVFKEWARSWARRTIIQSAIRWIGPRKRSATSIRNIDVPRGMDKVPLVLHAEVRAILDLAPFERFVFVMSVLERYSDHECSILLGCPRRDIATARARAMRQLVTLLGLKHKSPAEARSKDSVLPEDAEAVIELMIAQYFATPASSRSLSP